MSPHSERSWSEEYIYANDGTRLFFRSWRPRGRAWAAVAIVHGLHSHSAFYAQAGETLAASGIYACAIDLRGRGRSSGERFFIQDFGEYLIDVESMIDLARVRAPSVPLFLFGVGVGALISCHHLLSSQDLISGFISVGLTLQICHNWRALLLVRLLGLLAPRTGILRYPVGFSSRDHRFQDEALHDLLIHGEVQPARTVAELSRAARILPPKLASLQLPILCLLGTADSLASVESNRRFFAEVASSSKKFLLYEGHRHDLLNDTENTQVFEDICSWIWTVTGDVRLDFLHLQ